MYVGDIPAQMVIEVPQDLADYSGVTVKLRKPDNSEATLTSTLDVGLNAVVINWPNTSPITIPGRYYIVITLTGTGLKTRIPALPLIAQDTIDDGWHTLDSAREIWPDAEHLSDVGLYQLLNIARHQCLEFAPALAEGELIPEHYRRAQLMQAANIMNASAVDPATGEDGGTSFSLKPFPLDWHVKQLLRPSRGIPVAL